MEDLSIKELKKNLYNCLSQSMTNSNDIVELQIRLAIKNLTDLERSIEALDEIL
jgi:hypothetical protein